MLLPEREHAGISNPAAKGVGLSEGAQVRRPQPEQWCIAKMNIGKRIEFTQRNQHIVSQSQTPHGPWRKQFLAAKAKFIGDDPELADSLFMIVAV